MHISQMTLRCAGRQEVLAATSRLDNYQERPGDRAGLVDTLALAVLYSRLCSDEAPFDRKTMRLVLDLHQRVSCTLLQP
jgi:hypothetical protein